MRRTTTILALLVAARAKPLAAMTTPGGWTESRYMSSVAGSISAVAHLRFVVFVVVAAVICDCVLKIMLATMHPTMRDPFRSERRLGRLSSQLAPTATDVNCTASKDDTPAATTVKKRVSRRQTRKRASNTRTTLLGSGALRSASPGPTSQGINVSSPPTIFPSPVSSPSPNSSVESLDPSLLHVHTPHQLGEVSHTKTVNVKSFFSSFASRLSPLFTLGPHMSRKSRRSASPAKQSHPVTVKGDAMDYNHMDAIFSNPDSDGPMLDVSDFMVDHGTNVGVIPEREITMPRVVPVPIVNVSVSYGRTPEHDDNIASSDATVSIPVLLQRQDCAAEYFDFTHNVVQPEYSYQPLFMHAQPSYFAHHVHSAVDLGDQHELVTVLQCQDELRQQQQEMEVQQPSRKRSHEDFQEQQGLPGNAPARKRSLANIRKQQIVQDRQPARKRSHEIFALDDDQVTLTDGRDQELRRVASAQTLTVSQDLGFRRPTSTQTLTWRASEETLIGDITPEPSRSIPGESTPLHASTTSPPSSPSRPQGPSTVDDFGHVLHEGRTHSEEVVVGVDTSPIQSLALQPLSFVPPSIYKGSFAMQPAASECPIFSAATAMPSINAIYAYTPVTPPTRKSSPGAVFINYTEEDKETINRAVAPSGSSKSSKARRKSPDGSKKEKRNR
ncbi:hypothetical protein V1527DRAFT_112461 [Lipomyces starkeyi]